MSEFSVSTEDFPFFFLSSFFPIHYWAGNNQGIKQRLSMGEHSLPTAPCLNKKTEI